MPGFAAFLVVLILPALAAAQPVERLTLPAGFRIAVWAEVPGARSMAVVPSLDTVFVGSRGDAVHAVTGGRPRKVLGGLAMPNGIAWRDGWLYVVETHRVTRYRAAEAADLDGLPAARPEVLVDRLPNSRHHGWRYAAFGPDGRLWVGAPCNVCAVKGLEGTIIRLDPDDPRPEVFAAGIRNTVGMDFHPRTGDLFFTDNGADGMGDDRPPEELNRAPRAGLHFGFPWFGGGTTRTPAFADRKVPEAVTPPALTFGAHTAPLGIHFYRGEALPLAGDALIAQHGSWNRSTPDGYRLVRVRFDAEGRPRSSEPFADGFLAMGHPWGRPVDVKELPDGSLLVSDDRAGALYRITYEGP